ncbi:hypothetical protein CHS0354_024809 [Potamilus streckersoni]|uniref:Uncharacterized protein n=1 Tax=Potamilus streckersoni TaxID=2493646 RepID=A0AAE0W3V0_9BIVA|nr:hypothetical protein CHS0354_024809 [Potamilus streckersoni]
MMILCGDHETGAPTYQFYFCGGIEPGNVEVLSRQLGKQAYQIRTKYLYAHNLKHFPNNEVEELQTSTLPEHDMQFCALFSVILEAVTYELKQCSFCTGLLLLK